MPRVKTYAVINQKGGVGKTTTVANVGAFAAAAGRKTCLIDLDPQAHLTLHFGIEPGGPDVSIYEVLVEQAPIDAAAVRLGENLSVVPSVIDLAAAEVELVSTVGREQILRDSLAGSGLDCDLVMIDCAPSLGLLTLNALAAADEVLIPLQPHFLALQGLGKLLETVSLVQQRINPKLKVAGVIFCMYETATRLAGEVAADLESFLASARGGDLPWSNARIFSRRIRRNIKLAECPSHGKTIFDYDPQSIGAEDYVALAEEFLQTAFPAEQASVEPIPQQPATETQITGKPDPTAEMQPPADTDAREHPASPPDPPAPAPDRPAEAAPPGEQPAARPCQMPEER